MEQKAFEQIVASLRTVLEKQGYTLDEDSVREVKSGLQAFFIGKEMAYGVFYEAENKRFALRYCSVEDGRPEEKWRNRSVLLFDPENADDARSMTDSVIADFTDEVSEKDNTAAALKQVKKHHKKKTEESKTDALFFFNRLVNVFPEVREEIAVERITYGDIRTASFAREKILPKLHALLQGAENPAADKKVAEIFSELYENGDVNVRSVITFVLINSLSDAEMAVLEPYFSQGMKVGSRSARGLRGKKLKPEKPKKIKHIIADNLNDMR
ncbi:MAG: hypothetical protein LKF71_01870 [Oscillospiraceae bacterium]|nr:hypothetical protein [Oscillospiraceae bacterium]